MDDTPESHISAEELVARSVFAIIPVDDGSGLISTEAGTGFLIHLGKTMAYGITATHIFLPALSRAEEGSIKERLRHLGPTKSVPGYYAIRESQKYFAVFNIKGSPKLYSLRPISYADSSDVCIVKVTPWEAGNGESHELGLLLPGVLSLFPDFGPEIALVGIDYNRESMISNADSGGHTIELDIRMQRSPGKVTLTVKEAAHRQLQSIVPGRIFLTNIKIQAGMSGGPVFHAIDTPGVVMPPLICGVASSNWDFEYSANTAINESISVCSSILNVLPMRIEDEKTVLDFLLEDKIYCAGVNPRHFKINSVEEGVYLSMGPMSPEK